MNHPLPGALRGVLFILITVPLVAWNETPALDDCGTLPCGEVLPGAVVFEPVANAPYLKGLDVDGNLVGWVILSTDVTDLKGYSGKPLVTLVGLDPTAHISGVRVVKHSEPILLVGIPEQELHDFAAFYTGKHATTQVVVGRSSDPDAVQIDAISGATVTALAQNRTILDSALALGSAVGIVEAEQHRQGAFVTSDEIYTWDRMAREKVFGRLTVTAKDMGLKNQDEVFMDLWYTLADAPQVGRAILPKGDYDYLIKQLKPGEHMLVVLGRGSGSFKGSGFVRGGLFDRIRVSQGLHTLFFRDSDYYNLSRVAAPDAPTFKEGAIFITRDAKLDPGAAFEMVFLGSNYDGKGGFSRDFWEFKSQFRMPRSVYQTEGPDPETRIWVQAWRNNRLGLIVVCAALLTAVLLFSFRRWLTARMPRLMKIHKTYMLFSFLVLGFVFHAQPSVTQVLTLVGSVVGQWDWGLFLIEPVLFVSWIFIAIVTIIWGRGVFCGWVCPFGALTELLNKIAIKMGVKQIEWPDAVHNKLRWLRYLILAGLIPAYLYSPELGERLAEVEPFKTTFFVIPWTRSWLFFSWWLVLLGWSLFMYRPFCRYICPLGAALAIPGSLRLSGPRRRNFCASCKICTKGCEPRAIRPNGTIDPRECLSCMECEANYRDEKVCPPLVGLEKLRHKEDLTDRDREKQAQLEKDFMRV